MVKTIIIIALIVVVLSMLAMFIRIIKGPTLPDRVLIGILAFLGTAVFSKFIDKGKVIERDSKNHH